jgi:hypothetical protein
MPFYYHRARFSSYPCPPPQPHAPRPSTDTALYPSPGEYDLWRGAMMWGVSPTINIPRIPQSNEASTVTGNNHGLT